MFDRKVCSRGLKRAALLFMLGSQLAHAEGLEEALPPAEGVSSQDPAIGLEGNLLGSLGNYDGKLGDINLLLVGNRHHGFVQGGFSLPILVKKVLEIERLKSVGVPRNGAGIGYRYLIRGDSARDDRFIGGYLFAHAKDNYWFYQRANIDGGVEFGTENLQWTFNGYCVYPVKDVPSIYQQETSWGYSARLSTYYWQKMKAWGRVNPFFFGARTKVIQKDSNPEGEWVLNGGIGFRWELIYYTDIAFEGKFVWDTLKTGKDPDFQFGVHLNLAQRSDRAGNYPVHRLRALPQRYRPSYEREGVSGVSNDGTRQSNDNREDESRNTPLHDAIVKGHPDIVEKLLASPGIDVNQRGRNGNTPLHEALQQCHINIITKNIVEALLASPGIDINLEDKNGNTPFVIAVQQRHKDIAKALLTFPGVDVNKKDRNGNTPLHDTIAKGHPDIVEKLLASPGIDVNQENQNGETTLAFAVQYGHKDIAKALLTYPGIDVNKRDRNGNTPLHEALQQCYKDIAKALLAYPGIDIDLEDKNGNKPLNTAIQRCDTDIVEKLLAFLGIDINREDQYGFPPLHAAIQRCDIATVQALLAYPGIDINLEDKNGNKPLNTAIQTRNIDIVKALLAYPGIDINRENSRGYTPLGTAIRMGHTEIVEILLDCSEIDVTCDTNLYTPLDDAVDIDNTELRASLIKILLRHGTGIGSHSKGRDKLLFRNSLELRDESLLRNLIAAGLNTQLDDKHDLLDKIPDEAMRDRMKTYRNNLISEVQKLKLFVGEKLDVRAAYKRLRLIVNVINSLKVIKALGCKDKLDLQIARYQEYSQKKLKSFEEFKASQEDYIFYVIQKKQPKLKPELMLEIVRHLRNPEKLGLEAEGDHELIRVSDKLYCELENPDSELFKFYQTCLRSDCTASQ